MQIVKPSNHKPSLIMHVSKEIFNIYATANRNTICRVWWARDQSSGEFNTGHFDKSPKRSEKDYARLNVMQTDNRMIEWFCRTYQQRRKNLWLSTVLHIFRFFSQTSPIYIHNTIIEYIRHSIQSFCITHWWAAGRIADKVSKYKQGVVVCGTSRKLLILWYALTDGYGKSWKRNSGTRWLNKMSP